MIGWAIEGLVASGVLMALVLAIRGPVRRAFGADVAYALWALPVLRLALPPLPQTVPHLLPPVIGHAAMTPVARIGEPVAMLLATPVGGAVQAAAPVFDWAMVVPVLSAVWLIGALAFAGFHVLAHRRFCRDLLDGAAPVEARGGIAVIETPAARGPLAFGILRRYVAFPADFSERYDDAERDLALAHELGHHARGDLIANWIALVVLALHWFNPVAWYAFRAFRTDQEVANDARVLAGRPAITRHTYACAILKAAHGGTVSAACHLHTIDDLKGRLRMLTTRRISRTRLVGGTATVALVGVAALGLTASGTQAAEHVRARVETATGVDIAVLDRRVSFKPFAPFKPIPAMGAAPAMERAVVDDIVPPAPPAPLSPDIRVEAPRPPHAPHMTSVTDKIVTTDGREMRHHSVRIDDEDIDTNDRFATLPQVVSTRCGTGADRPLVIHDMQDGKRRITICNDRIEKVQAHADAMAASGVAKQRAGYRAALASLRKARADLVANQSMPADARRDALQSIDETTADLTADMTQAD
jgi:beta-lactamase regulating signal transducer with metallopeptidase domain